MTAKLCKSAKGARDAEMGLHPAQLWTESAFGKQLGPKVVAIATTLTGMRDPLDRRSVKSSPQAGIPVGAWVEQALGKALAEGLEPGVSIEEIEARLRQVVTDALQPVQQTLTRIETATAPGPPDGSSSIRLLRERLRQRRGR